MGLYVSEEGPAAAEPVVFLHGAASSTRQWDIEGQQLAEELRCLYIDLPGHGRSAGTAWVSIDDAAATVADTLRQHTAGRVSVVGVSLGGYVALRLAMTEPERVSGVIVSGVSVVPASFGVRMWQRSQLVARYAGIRRAMASGSTGLGADSERVGVTEQVVMPARTALAIADEVAVFELPERPKRWATPLLAVAGEHESRDVLRSLSRLARRFSPSWAKYVPDAGPLWPAEQPGLFGAMVRSWTTERRLPPKLRDPEQWTG